MANLIRAKTGSVYIENVEGPQYFSIQGIELARQPGFILNNVRISRKESLQHLKTMTAKVYSYAFGELPGVVQVGGLIFFQDGCGAPAGTFGQANNYYEQNRAFVKGRATFISVGGAAFKVALSGIDLMAEAGPFTFGRFQLSFTILPQDG